jgi:cation:H+ antiporter
LVCREGWSAGGSAISVATLLAFVAGLALTLLSSELLARGLTRLGTKLAFSEGLLGLLAALGADSPELSSAVVAILSGAGAVGVGVVVGSNLFNLAALLGLPAVVAGGVLIRRQPLLLDAAVGLFVVGAAALMVAGAASPQIALAVVVPIAAAYVVVLAVPARLIRRLRSLAQAAPQNVLELAYEVTHDIPVARHGSWTPVVLLPAALAGVVGGSFVMVHQALAAQHVIGLSDAVLGTVVLAALTSLPNLWVALHFARTNRGTALFSSAMNSNTINLIGGLIVPALFFGISAMHGALADFTWLVELTLLAVLAPLPHGRLSPVAGGVIIFLYLAFATLTLVGL